MSKSFYSYKIEPSAVPEIENAIKQVLFSESYAPIGGNTFSKGSGWFLIKRKFDYLILGDTLNICVWKPWAIFVPSWEIGCLSADNFFGGVINSEIKNLVQRIFYTISQICPVTPLTNCVTVPDDHLLNISRGAVPMQTSGVPQGSPAYNTMPNTYNYSAPVQPAVQQNVSAFCTNCGSPIVPGSQFCNNCGHKH